MESLTSLTLYHATYAKYVLGIKDNIQLLSKQASDFTAPDCLRAFYLTPNIDDAIKWAKHSIENNKLVKKDSGVNMAVMTFSLDTSGLKTYDFGNEDSNEWKEFTFNNYAPNATTMHKYAGCDVIMGPMTDGKQKGDVSEMTQWKWSENGAGVRQVALLTQAALDKLKVVGTTKYFTTKYLAEVAYGTQ